jgi:hypothetical protein
MPNQCFLGLCLILVLAAGCSGSGRLSPPALSPHASATKALADYDANKDGLLDAKELEQCPALKSGLEAIDQDHDGKISHGEIAARLGSYSRSGVAVTTVSFEFLLDDAWLSNATVTLIPEPFMLDAIKPAEGVTDKFGIVAPEAKELGAPGIQCGMYRISVSLKDADGKEQLPARYNTATTLGQEIAPDMRQGNMALKLKRK